MIIRIIIGVLAAVAGFFMVLRPQFFLEAIGEQAWMEKVFGGSGSGISGYKVLGVIIIIVGFLIITDMIQAVVLWFFGPFIKPLAK